MCRAAFFRGCRVFRERAAGLGRLRVRSAVDSHVEHHGQVVRSLLHAAGLEAVEDLRLKDLAPGAVVELEDVVDALARVVGRIGGVAGGQDLPRAAQDSQGFRVGGCVHVSAEEDGLRRFTVVLLHDAVDRGGLNGLLFGGDVVEVGRSEHEAVEFRDDKHARFGADPLFQHDGEGPEGLFAADDSGAVAASVERHGGAEGEGPAAEESGDAFELEDPARAVGAAVEFVHADGIGSDLLHHGGDERVVVRDVFVEDADVVGDQSGDSVGFRGEGFFRGVVAGCGCGCGEQQDGCQQKSCSEQFRRFGCHGCCWLGWGIFSNKITHKFPDVQSFPAGNRPVQRSIRMYSA